MRLCFSLARRRRENTEPCGARRQSAGEALVGAGRLGAPELISSGNTYGPRLGFVRLMDVLEGRLKHTSVRRETSCLAECEPGNFAL